MSYFPQIFSVTRVGQIDKMDPIEYDGDPRGIVWCWEPPLPHATYCMGVDPTFGRTGWTRHARVKDDHKTNNGAIEIVRVGKEGKPDAQVCEFTAPMDSFDLAYVVNILGRLYAGVDNDQCKCIIEVFPGPGAGTLQQCLELGYTNHFKWEYYGDTVASPTRAWGWHASPRTNRDLWAKASRHLILQQCIVKSPWLVEEFANCRLNVEKEYAENPHGQDDRMRAFSLALWIANSWNMNIERTAEKVLPYQEMDCQRSDLSMEEIQETWGEVFDRLS